MKDGGDEVQGIGGSYFVELHKDGVHVSAVNDSTRGQNSTHNGPQGNKYNYLKTVPLSQVPGGNVAGNYTIWVKDGTGERDSQNYTFTVSGGNGEVWPHLCPEQLRYTFRWDVGGDSMAT